MMAKSDSHPGARRLRIPAGAMTLLPDGAVVASMPGIYWRVWDTVTLANGDMGLWLIRVADEELSPGTPFTLLTVGDWATPPRA